MASPRRQPIPGDFDHGKTSTTLETDVPKVHRTPTPSLHETVAFVSQYRTASQPAATCLDYEHNLSSRERDEEDQGGVVAGE